MPFWYRMDGRPTDFEEIFMDKQRSQPGCWDGRLSNWRGEVYSEARHGLNPLAQGFSICMPVATPRRE